MLAKRLFWNAMMFGAILLWVAVIVAGSQLFETAAGKAILPVGLLLMHCGEYPLSSAVGKAKGLSAVHTFLHTAVFGFTWWMPLKMGVIDR